MDNIEFGAEIKNIFLFPQASVYDEIFVFEKVVIETNKFLIIEPHDETDEVKLNVTDKFDIPSDKVIYNYNEFKNRRLISLWKCENDNGYMDQIIIGVDLLRPSISFLCECGLIGVFDNKPKKVGELNLLNL